MLHAGASSGLDFYTSNAAADVGKNWLMPANPAHTTMARADAPVSACYL